MMLSLDQFKQKAADIAVCLEGSVGFDFETTGLHPFKDSKAFLMGFTDTVGTKYSVKLDQSYRAALDRFFSNPLLHYCAHNAKFELGFLDAQFDIKVAGHVWDTEVYARVECNKHFTYGLQACAQRLTPPASKHEAMLDWLKIRGNKEAYFRAPEDIIIPYVEQDAWLSWKLRQHQKEVFNSWDTSSPVKIRNVVLLERSVLRHLFEMEKVGLLIDVAYCKKAYEYEQTEISGAASEFRRLAGCEFVDSRKTLQPVFDAHGVCYGKTVLGNASFTEDSLKSDKSHPVVAALMRHRRALKRSSAYWSNFLELEHNGIIHPSIHQNKAQTGRMSISNPSCQNWSTDEDEGTHFPIRRAFIARPDCLIASLDYSQMELRKSADEAEDFPMIERVLAGADLHQEVADMASVPRSLAKNGRFCRQYGGGVPKMAATLGIEMHVAQKIADALDAQAKATTAYSRNLSKTCKPFGYDWMGRRFYFDRGFEYKAFNYRIQGGCAEILKLAIIEIGKFLKQHARSETFMLLPIHDEIVLNMHKEDLYLLPKIKELMIAAHRDKKFLSMDVGVEVGPNLYDLEKVKL